jgi:membrane-associated PAP2 superfamily phosphatase
MIGLSFLLSAVLATLMDMDPHLSGYFYDPTAAQRWFLKTAAPWIWLYRYGELPVLILAIGAAVVWGGSFCYRSWVGYRRACALIVLAVMLGPGLLVNGVLKPLWGRPRPTQAELFGGSRPYQPWWQPGHIGGGRSFPSGHAAMGYVLVLGTCLVPSRRSAWLRGLVLGGALTYGSLLGAARIIQGGHFLSDVLWSGSLMCFLVATLQAVLPTPASPQMAASQNPPTVFNTR